MAAHGSKPRHDVSIMEDVFVEMRDGTPLATDVYLPAEDGRPVSAFNYIYIEPQVRAWNHAINTRYYGNKV